MDNIKKLEFEIEKKDCIEYAKEANCLKNFDVLWAGYVVMSMIVLIASFVLGKYFGISGIALFLFCAMPSVVNAFKGSGGGEIIYNSFKDKKITYEFSKNGIRIVRSESDTFYTWNNILKVYQTKNLIIIFMRPYKGFRFDATGMFIPKNFFSSEEECVKFIEEISYNIKEKF